MNKRKGIEYRMLIRPVYDETVRKDGTEFLIETVKQFSNFSYEVVVGESTGEKQLTWALHGLRAPELLMPSFGGARYSKVYFDMNGTYTFTLKKIDGEVNDFRLKILPGSAKLLSQPETPFVSMYLSEKLFEERREEEMEIPQRKPDIKRLPEHSRAKKRK